MESLLYPMIALGGLGLAFGLLLSFASRKFAVPVDPKVAAVRALLPGANCGACGFEGCDIYAENVAAGKAEINRCPVGGGELAAALAAVMGTEAEVQEKKVASVRCRTSCERGIEAYIYQGIRDCRKATVLPGGGPNACSYSCLGFGTCIPACAFGALSVQDGVIVVDRHLCVGCGKCVEACPRGVLEMIPVSQPVRLACNNADKGVQVREVCPEGCIGCGLCAKVCEAKAIEMRNNLPVIDGSLCVGCGKCVEKCPVKAIVVTPAGEEKTGAGGE